MSDTVLSPSSDATAILTGTQTGWLDLAVDLLADGGSGPSRVHGWVDGRVRSISSTRKARDAIRAGECVIALHPATTVFADLDDAAAARAVGAVTAALGLVAVVSPSGAVRDGFVALSAFVPCPSAEHAAALTAAVAGIVGDRRVARTGGWARTLLSPGFKPTHAPGHPASGGLLAADGAFVQTDAATARAALTTAAPLPVEALDDVVRAHGGAPAATTVVGGTEALGVPTATVGELLAALSPDLREVAGTDGAGYGCAVPGSRSEGEMAVVCALVRRGVTAADLLAVLAATPLGTRMRERARGRHSRYVTRLHWQAVKFIARDSGVGVARVPEAVLAAGWALAVPAAQRVVFAVLAVACERAGRGVVGLSRRQLEEATGLDHRTAVDALRAHPAVEEVAVGSGLGIATTWRPVMPPAGASTVAGLPTPATVADVAGSDIVAAGVLGAHHRATAIVVAAALTETPATRRDLARVAGVHADRVTTVLRRLADAGIATRADRCRWSIDQPLWLHAVETGVAGVVDSRRARNAERRASAEVAFEVERRRFAAAGRAFADGPVGEGLVVVEPSEPVAQAPVAMPMPVAVVDAAAVARCASMNRDAAAAVEAVRAVTGWAAVTACQVIAADLRGVDPAGTVAAITASAALIVTLVDGGADPVLFLDAA